MTGAGYDRTGAGYDRWLERAACRGTDPSVFCGTGQQPSRRAQKCCHVCPVRYDCLLDALELGDWDTVRAGLSGRRRRQLRPLLVRMAASDAGLESLRHLAGFSPDEVALLTQDEA